MSVTYVSDLQTISLSKFAVADLSDLHLDAENPRFASSNLLPEQITQQSILDYLVEYADVTGLAHKIANYGGLFNESIITACYNTDKQLVVLEGNRRITACKLLAGIAFMSDSLKEAYPLPTNITDDLKKQISKINLVLYDDSDSAQKYIAQKHTTTDVKGWSTIEKYNYYFAQFKGGKSPQQIAANVVGAKIQSITKSLKHFILFQKIFYYVRQDNTDLKIEAASILPLVEAFMPTICGNGEFGLELDINETTLDYEPLPHKTKLYKQILLLIGNAFLNRPAAKKKDEHMRRAKNDEFLISSDEIRPASAAIKVIAEDIRIPGLKRLIHEYQEVPQTKETITPPADNLLQPGDTPPIQTPISGNIPTLPPDIHIPPSKVPVPVPVPPTTLKTREKELRFFANLMFEHIDPANPDNLGLVNVCKEIRNISTYHGYNGYINFPISAAFLLRSLIEQVVTKQLKVCNQYEKLKANSNKTPQLERMMSHIIKYIKTGNSQEIFGNNPSIAKAFTACFEGHGTKDQLDIVIHRPEQISPDQNFLDGLANQGIKSLLQSMINTFE